MKNLVRLFETQTFSKSLLIESLQVSKEFFKIAFPQILYFCCIFLQASLNIFFISHEYKDQDMLNAIGISNLYVNLTTGVILQGIIGALDTLSSNAYGAKNFKLLGIYNDRCRYISLSYWLLIAIFNFFFSRTILGFLKVEERVIDYALEYISVFIFSYIFTINFQINTKIFVLIEKSHLNLLIAVASLVLHGTMCWFFVCVVKFGIRGASVSVTITSIFNLVVSTYILNKQNIPKEAIVYFTKDGLKNWYGYLKIALPGVLISGGEWLGYEIQGMLAIFISPLAYSTMILTMNLEMLMFPLTLGVGTAIALKSGEKFIKESTFDFIKYVTICYGFTIIMSLILLILVEFFGNSFFYYMAPNKDIYKECASLNSFVCWYAFVVNGYQYYIGVLKAMGYLKNPTYVTFIIFYFVEIGLSYILCFKFNNGAKGIWISLGIGCTSAYLIFLVWVYSFDLDSLKEKALERIKNDDKHIVKDETEVINEEITETRERLLFENN